MNISQISDLLSFFKCTHYCSGAWYGFSWKKGNNNLNICSLQSKNADKIISDCTSRTLKQTCHSCNTPPTWDYFHPVKTSLHFSSPCVKLVNRKNVTSLFEEKVKKTTVTYLSIKFSELWLKLFAFSLLKRGSKQKTGEKLHIRLCLLIFKVAPIGYTNHWALNKYAEWIPAVLNMRAIRTWSLRLSGIHWKCGHGRWRERGV